LDAAGYTDLSASIALMLHINSVTTVTHCKKCYSLNKHRYEITNCVTTTEVRIWKNTANRRVRTLPRFF